MKFDAGARAVALLKLLGFVAALLVVVGLASFAFKTVLDTGGSDGGDSSATSPSTIVDGITVPMMRPVECDADCTPTAILIGADEYVLNDDPSVEVIAANVTDEVFAAGEVGSVDGGSAVEFAYVVENVDPAVLLAGKTGSTFVAVTGPSIESTTADPTIEVLFTVCVSLVDATSYAQCRALVSPPAEETPGG